MNKYPAPRAMLRYPACTCNDCRPQLSSGIDTTTSIRPTSKTSQPHIRANVKSGAGNNHAYLEGYTVSAAVVRSKAPPDNEEGGVRRERIRADSQSRSQW